MPLTGRGLDIRIEGSAPLTLANRFVADRGGQLSGGVTFNVAVSGNTSAPRISGNVSLADAGYIDPELNLRLVGITGNASLDGDRLVIGALSANLSTGGSVSVGGSIGLGTGIPADLTVRLNSARYADGDLFVATVSGDLAVSGPIAGEPNPLRPPAGREGRHRGARDIRQRLGAHRCPPHRSAARRRRDARTAPRSMPAARRSRNRGAMCFSST